MIAIEWKPEPRSLRRFGVCTGFFLALLGLWVFIRHTLIGISISPDVSQTLGIVFWIVGAGMFVLGISVPKLLYPVYIGMNVIALPIGLVVSHVVLFLVYYVVFSPLGLFFRLIGRDVLHRKPDPAAATYWTDHDPTPPAKRYFRQF